MARKQKAVFKKDNRIEVQNTATFNGKKGTIAKVVPKDSFPYHALLDGRRSLLAFQEHELKLIEEQRC